MFSQFFMLKYANETVFKSDKASFNVLLSSYQIQRFPSLCIAKQIRKYCQQAVSRFLGIKCCINQLILYEHTRKHASFWRTEVDISVSNVENTASEDMYY